jgi:adenine-specific DNA-methyltransferase
MSKFTELTEKLREIFQIDRPELDFGVYRILNARAGEINEYLDKRLEERVKLALASGSAANLEHVRQEIVDTEAKAKDLGVSPDDLPKVKELRLKITELESGAVEYENAVFSHLLTFFSRYYESGDFISQRRYKGNTYAIPYAGEEVMLHWANKDQYYTKSGESFSNYSFKLSDGRTVHCRLIAADTAKDNRKDNDKERRFALIETMTVTRVGDDGEEWEESLIPVEELNGELTLRFTYKAMPKGTKQDALTTKAVAAILESDCVKSNWLDLTKREPTEKNPQRTLLEKHLTNYTQKNSADYFIHKNLGEFLRGELDFYIKNEVMNLDDVQNAQAFANIEKSLRMIQCLRAIALDLIVFLAQLEDFQKKLWLKKKFVVSAHYCMTLDRVPEALYPAIVANAEQWKQWHELGMRETANPGSIADLTATQSLMVDTVLFDAAFKCDLLKAVPNLDDSLNGLLIHGDNFQALGLIEQRYKNEIGTVYIDPPYNTDASAILYKNGYKDSSWLSLMSNRIDLARSILRDDALFCVAIDDQEVSNLRSLMGQYFQNEIGVAVVKSNPQSRKTRGKFSPVHEYALFYGNSDKSLPYSIGFSASKAARYPLKDETGSYSWMNFIRAGSNDLRSDRPKLYYPIAVSAEGKIRIPKMEWQDSQREYLVLENISDNETLVYPNRTVNGIVVEKNWQRGNVRVATEYDEYRVRRQVDGSISIDFKTRMDDEAAPVTWWDKGEYASANYGASELKNLFGNKSFDFPKAKKLVEDGLRACGSSEPNSITLDFFAGSGTTGEAVISISRETKLKHKYVLIEQGDYFETIIKPRIKKVVFSADWRDGSPTSPEKGISQSIKVLKIEGYEDTLNNLKLRRTMQQNDLLESIPTSAKDEYLLKYMLNVESKGSLLSITSFKKPFDFKLNISVDSAGASEASNIDLVETFNYLVGLRVKSVDLQIERGFATVEGLLPSGEKALILWRDCEIIGYDALAKLCEKLAINPGDTEYDVVFVNGDHNIMSAFSYNDGGVEITKTLKLKQIEPAFLDAMFGSTEEY